MALTRFDEDCIKSLFQDYKYVYQIHSYKYFEVEVDAKHIFGSNNGDKDALLKQFLELYPSEKGKKYSIRRVGFNNIILN